MLASLPRPIVFAHRGASARAPENTFAAFALAVQDGAAAIELDARLTADGRVVVIHDATLDRTTNGSGRVLDKTAAELREMDAGSHFSAQFRGERIPLLEEVFEALGKLPLVNVQLKPEWNTGRDLVREVCGIVRRHGLQSRVLLSSFHAPSLKAAARLLPDLPLGLLAVRGWAGAWARSFGFTFGDYAALHPHLADASPQQVQRVHRLARRVHVWTVNDPAEVARLAEWNVDGILTDDPKAALRALGRSL